MFKLCLLLCVVGIVLGEDTTAPKAIIESSAAFTINLYNELTKSNQGNIAFSGLSLHTVLALTSLGAKGDTAAELKSALQLTIPDEQIKKDFKLTTQQINTVGDVTVYTANKAYLADDIKVVPDFLNTAKEDFSADVETVKFSDAKVTAGKINAWVEEKTHNKIKDLISEDDLSEITRFVLVNTLYFNGKWLHTFPTYQTEKADFHKSQTEVVQVDTMKVTASLPYQHNHALGASILELPYVDPRAKFYVIFPDQVDGVSATEKNIGALRQQLNLTSTYATVSLPKFRIESKIDFIPVLKNLGVTKIFGRPDLTGIANEAMVISAVLQKTYVDVTEQGTEAASASAVEGITRGLLVSPVEPIEIKVDRPFLYCIDYDGLTIIAGRVNNL